LQALEATFVHQREEQEKSYGSGSKSCLSNLVVMPQKLSSSRENLSMISNTSGVLAPNTLGVPAPGATLKTAPHTSAPVVVLVPSTAAPHVTATHVAVSTTHVTAPPVTATHVVPVTSTHVVAPPVISEPNHAAPSVTATHVAVTPTHVAAPFMTAPHVAVPPVISPHVAVTPVAAPHVAPVITTEVAEPHVTSSHVDALSVTGTHVTAPSVTELHLAAPAVTTSHVVTAETTSHVVTSSGNATHVTAPSVTPPHVAELSVTAPHITPPTVIEMPAPDIALPTAPSVQDTGLSSVDMTADADAIPAALSLSEGVMETPTTPVSSSAEGVLETSATLAELNSEKPAEMSSSEMTDTEATYTEDHHPHEVALPLHDHQSPGEGAVVIKTHASDLGQEPESTEITGSSAVDMEYSFEKSDKKVLDSSIDTVAIDVPEKAVHHESCSTAAVVDVNYVHPVKEVESVCAGSVSDELEKVHGDESLEVVGPVGTEGVSEVTAPMEGVAGKDTGRQGDDIPFIEVEDEHNVIRFVSNQHAAGVTQESVVNIATPSGVELPVEGEGTEEVNISSEGDESKEN